MLWPSSAAKRVASISPSKTYEVMERAARMRAEGRDVISLAAGEPDFATPLHIQQAAIEAIGRGETKYTAAAGMKSLREAVAEKFHRENGIDCGWSNIVVSNGAKQVIANAFLATLDVGDEVLIPAPHWVSYPDMAALCGAVPVSIETTARTGFKITPEQLAAALTPATRWLVINNPCNPTGAVYSRAELRGLADVVLEHPDLLVLSDDIYEHIVFSSAGFSTLAQVEPRLADRVLTVNGVSKSYAMTGWRIGYACGPVQLINDMIKIQGQQTSSPCSISQWAALAALAGPQDFVAAARKEYAERSDFTVQAINAIPRLSCSSPDGTFYVFISCARTFRLRTPSGHVIVNDEDFVRLLLDETGVALVPGSAFGISGYLRLSCSTSMEELSEGVCRLREFCESLKEETVPVLREYMI